MRIRVKFLAIILMFITTASAYANKVFVGDDYFGDSHYKGINSDFEDNIQKNSRYNYGTNFGYKIDEENLRGSAEVFYGGTEVSTRNLVVPDSKVNKVELENRYGAKFNAGYAIKNGVTPFVSVGVANIRQNQKGLDSDAYSQYELTPTYGVGLVVEFPLSTSSKKHK